MIEEAGLTMMAAAELTANSCAAVIEAERDFYVQ